jgi:glutaminase
MRKSRVISFFHVHTLPSWFGVSIITVDGQTFDYGDCDLPFSIQSCIKPLVYSMAIEELGYG